MYYAAKNTHASETSIGFSNTWYVIAFPTRGARDAHVAASTDRATKSIKSSEVRTYGAEPGPTNFADYWDQGFLSYIPSQAR